MEIFKLKTELDTSQATNVSLKETISIKENDIRVLHERILDVSVVSHLTFSHIRLFFVSRKRK